ncbi:MAG: glycosyltransferase [Bacteroidia bacterium]|nr:glycosyltransferase [Bacteroidia bacterium]
MKKDTHILVITYWKFDDALIQTYTLPYLKIIESIVGKDSKIYLLTLDAATRPINQITSVIYNISKTYFPFGLKSLFEWVKNFIFLIRFIKKNKIQYVHCLCTPAGVAGYILCKLTGAKLILDSFEPHAEAMVENNTWKKNSLRYKFLFRFEKLQLKLATHVICAAEGMIAYSQKKYNIKKENYFVKPACVDFSKFESVQKDFKLLDGITENNIICIYAGKFNGIYLEKEVFDFFAVAHSHWGDKFKVVLLTNESKEKIDHYCLNSNLNSSIITLKFVPHSDVPKYMALSDFGICPVKPVPTKQFCTPIKNGEYWAMGLPVVITKNISEDSDIIQTNDIGYVLNALNEEEYLKAIIKIESLLLNKEKLKLKIVEVAKKYRSFSIAEKIYKSIYA